MSDKDEAEKKPRAKGTAATPTAAHKANGTRPASPPPHEDDASDDDVELLLAAFAGPFLVGATNDPLPQEKQEALIEVLNNIAADDDEELDEESLRDIASMTAARVGEKGDEVLEWIAATVVEPEDRETIFALAYYVAATPDDEPSDEEAEVLEAIADVFGFDEDKCEAILLDHFGEDDEDDEDDDKDDDKDDEDKAKELSRFSFDGSPLAGGFTSEGQPSPNDHCNGYGIRI